MISPQELNVGVPALSIAPLLAAALLQGGGGLLGGLFGRGQQKKHSRKTGDGNARSTGAAKGPLERPHAPSGRGAEPSARQIPPADSLVRSRR